MKTLRTSAWISTIAAFVLLFTHDSFELGNPYPGIVLDLLILTTLALTLRDARGFPKVWIPVLVSNLLVAGTIFQGVYGGESALESLLNTAWFMMSIMTAMLLLYACMQLRFIRHPYAERSPLYPARLRGWLTFVFILVLMQIGLGSFLSGVIEQTGDVLLTEGYIGRASAASPFAILHQTIGVLIALISMHRAAIMIKQAERPTPLVYNASLVAGGGAIGVMLIGAAILALHNSSILQMFHLWLASLLLGSLLIMQMSVKYNFLSSIASYMPDRKR